MFDIVSVGHFAIDSIFLPDKNMPFIVLGGSVAYASFAARRLGATVSVVSKVGGDFPKAYLWWLEQEGVNLSGVVKTESAQTTRFELKYSNNLSNRKLRLKSKAPSITVDDLPKSLEAKTIHIAPIAGEVTYKVAKRLRSARALAQLFSATKQRFIKGHMCFMKKKLSVEFGCLRVVLLLAFFQKHRSIFLQVYSDPFFVSW